MGFNGSQGFQTEVSRYNRDFTCMYVIYFKGFQIIQGNSRGFKVFQVQGSKVYKGFQEISRDLKGFDWFQRISIFFQGFQII